MLNYGLAFVALFVADLIANVLTLPLHAFDKKLQWAGKSLEHWQAIGVPSPGERLRSISFAVGLVSTTITRFIGFWVAARVFVLRGVEMPIGFVIGAAVLLLVNDCIRIARFVGNRGVWTELGYGLGGLVVAGALMFR